MIQIWEDDSTLPRPISNPTVTAFVPLYARHLEKGMISVTGSKRPGDFVLVDCPVHSPQKTIPFLSSVSLYTMAATPLVLRNVLDV